VRAALTAIIANQDTEKYCAGDHSNSLVGCIVQVIRPKAGFGTLVKGLPKRLKK